MKITYLLGQYLLQHKKMRLQGIGEFVLDDFYENPFENEKGKIRLPENSIQFVPDRKAGEDEGLISFIAEKTAKIRSLASSDLEDFLTGGKQLLNISKQFYIDGLGTLILNDNGNYSFRQSNEAIVMAASQEPHPAGYTEKKDEKQESISFKDTYLKPGHHTGNMFRKPLIIFALILGLAIIGGVVYYFFHEWQGNKSTDHNVMEDIRPVMPDPVTVPTDTLSTHTDSTTALTPAGIASYKVIIETTGRQRALSRYDTLRKWGHQVQLSTKDSQTFNLYTTITGPLSDTARSRDSISRFFGRKARIELK